MDHEKIYNEALERAKKLSVDGYLDAIAVEEIFPELRESEDERVIRTLYYLVRDHDWLNGATKGEVLAWLEKQKEQKPNIEICPHSIKSKSYKEQKPAEWSEEDEDMLNCCISSIEEAKENRYAYKETDGDTSYDREIAFLKSLRPSWKPSEEQIEAPNFAITYFMHETNYKNPTELRELYDDLLKLK